MSEFVELYRSQLLIFLFVLARVGGLVVVAPVFGARQAPKYLRVALAVAIALMIAPVFWNNGSPEPDNAVALLIALCRESVLGLMMGLALAIVVAGLQAAGRVIGQMSGLSLAQVIDPEAGTSTSLFGKFFDLTATAAFLLVGGHRQVLSALLDTFEWMRPGNVGFSAGLFETLNEIVSQSFLLALRVSAPAVLALLLATLIVGFVSRAVPQLNTIALGLSLNSVLAIAIVSVTLGGAAWLFHEHATAAVEAVCSTFLALTS
jgi:flagellar biosynthetic protein FliR